MSTDPVTAFARVCRCVRPGEAADGVRGVVPAAVAAPGSLAEAGDLLRVAGDLGLAMLPRGSRTKLDWGAPPDRCDLIVDTTRLHRVIEHAAGDLVVRVQAGLPMAELAARLAPAGQQLALDTPGPPSAVPGATGVPDATEVPDATDVAAAVPSRAAGPSTGAAGTVGGVIATGAAGPRRLRYGAPRDLLIGITVVLSDGTVASSGGKVVKNVAGYDLGKLFAGSHGTLGLIAEAVFRLHPLPQSAVYLTLESPSAAAAADSVRAAIESQLVPSAAEIDQPAPGKPLSLGLLLEGATDALPERVARMRDILGSGTHAGPAPPPWWGRSVAGLGGVALRIAFPPGALATVLDAVGAAAEECRGDGDVFSPAVRGSAGVGVVEAGLDGATAPETVRSFAAALRRRLATPAAWGDVPGASVTVVHAPAHLYRAVTAAGPLPALGLMRAVKDRFDPGHLMSPGRLAGVV